MALKNLDAESWDGESRSIILKNITDADGAAVDFTTVTAASLKITTERGGGTTVITKSLGAMTATTTTLTIPIADSDWSVASPAATPGDYWWELSLTFGGDPVQFVAPSRYTFRESAT